MSLSTAIANALWRGLRRIVQFIGRWVVGELVRNGARALAAYMRVRTGVFRKRLARVLARRHAEWRPKFLRGRIRRWLSAAKWLDEQADKLAKLAVDKAGPYIDDLPEESPWENEAAWRRLAS